MGWNECTGRCLPGASSVAYTTATGNYKEKIGTQKWIALQNRGYEAWTEYRRLDFPVLVPPTTAKSGFPNRFTYPTNEQTLNGSNYTEAAAKMGGDKVESKIFGISFKQFKLTLKEALKKASFCFEPKEVHLM